MSLGVAQFFSEAEFACHDGTPYPEAWDDRWTILVISTCDPIRRMWGGQLQVISGYRTDTWNQGLIAKGHHDVASASFHIQGMAADLAPVNATAASVGALHDMILHAYGLRRLP